MHWPDKRVLEKGNGKKDRKSATTWKPVPEKRVPRKRFQVVLTILTSIWREIKRSSLDQFCSPEEWPDLRKTGRLEDVPVSGGKWTSRCLCQTA
ncbi:hypothetical protein ABH19_02970 [Leptospirillum sp. Group II 'CF-1']|jgi:hypothetical protein|nr:hypothetical protein ABH19_02970 [Leptospirillum sp. Group II 'CF-1']